MGERLLRVLLSQAAAATIRSDVQCQIERTGSATRHKNGRVPDSLAGSALVHRKVGILIGVVSTVIRIPRSREDALLGPGMTADFLTRLSFAPSQVEGRHLRIGDYVGKCRSALTQGAASAGGCSALSRAG